MNINKTFIYNVESGKKSLSKTMLSKVLNYYHVEYDRDIRLYEEAYDLTIKLYESFVFKNNELFEKYIKEFKEKEDIFENSRGFIFNELIVAIINLLKNKDLTSIMLEEASKYLLFYDDNISCIYAVIYGFAKDIYKNLEDTKKVIFDIYNNNTYNNIKPSIKGMLYYQIGKIIGYDNNPIEALRYYEEAIVYLKDIYCIERINQVKIEIAGVFLRLELFDTAEQKYHQAMEEAMKYNYNRRINACLNNLAYLYFIQKRYDECEEYVYKAKEAGSTHSDLNYYLAYIAYLKQPKKQARLVVNELLKNEEDLYTQRMLKMIQGFINDNQKQIDSFFNKTKKYLEKFDDVIEIKELYKLNIVYYKDKNLERYLQLVEEYHNILGN